MCSCDTHIHCCLKIRTGTLSESSHFDLSQRLVVCMRVQFVITSQACSKPLVPVFLTPLKQCVCTCVYMGPIFCTDYICLYLCMYGPYILHRLYMCVPVYVWALYSTQIIYVCTCVCMGPIFYTDYICVYLCMYGPYILHRLYMCVPVYVWALYSTQIIYICTCVCMGPIFYTLYVYLCMYGPYILHRLYMCVPVYV